MNITALLPVKGFHNAKQRLSPLLSTAARELLAETMFRDVLREVRMARGLVGTCVVTGDDKVASIAAAGGASVIRESAESGETNAVDFARYQLKSLGCEAVLILPGDMPLLRAADVEQLLAQVAPNQVSPFALLVPSHDRLGTNALLLAPPDAIQLRFGYDSFTFHCAQVIALGVPLCCLENEHFALDIDEPRDLERFLAYDLSDGDSTRLGRELLAQAAERSQRSALVV